MLKRLLSYVAGACLASYLIEERTPPTYIVSKCHERQTSEDDCRWGREYPPRSNLVTTPARVLARRQVTYEHAAVKAATWRGQGNGDQRTTSASRMALHAGHSPPCRFWLRDGTAFLFRPSRASNFGQGPCNPPKLQAEAMQL